MYVVFYLLNIIYIVSILLLYLVYCYSHKTNKTYKSINYRLAIVYKLQNWIKIKRKVYKTNAELFSALEQGKIDGIYLSMFITIIELLEYLFDRILLTFFLLMNFRSFLFFSILF